MGAEGRGQNHVAKETSLLLILSGRPVPTGGRKITERRAEIGKAVTEEVSKKGMVSARGRSFGWVL